MLKVIAANIIRAAVGIRSVGRVLSPAAAKWALALVLVAAPTVWVADEAVAQATTCENPASGATPTAAECRACNREAPGQLTTCGVCLSGHTDTNGNPNSRGNNSCIPWGEDDGEGTGYCRSVNQFVNADEDGCQQCPGTHQIFQGRCEEPSVCQIAGVDVLGQSPDSTNTCACEQAGHVVYGDTDLEEERIITRGSGAAACAPDIAGTDYADPKYTADTCMEGGWEVGVHSLALPGGAGYALVETCQVRILLVGNFANPAGPFTDSCVLRDNADGAPLQIAVGDNREHCGHDSRFRDHGFPNRPTEFGIGDEDALYVLATEEAATLRYFFDGVTLVSFVGRADPVDPDPVDPGPVDPGPVDPGPVDPGPVDPGPVDPVPTPSGGGGGGAGFAGGAAVLLGMAFAYMASSPDGASAADSFTFTPQAAYGYDNDIRHYRYGSRLEFHRDEWTLWWTADESRRGESDSERVYGYGGEWARDAVQARASAYYSEEDGVDVAAAVRMEWELRDWTISPAYRFSADGDADTGGWRVENSMDVDISARLIQAGWTIRPSMSADLWASEVMDARFRFQVGREF